MIYSTIAVAALALLGSADAFRAAAPMRSGARASALSAEANPKGAGFNYDPSNYKDSNSGNYRRLSDQLAAVKAEDEKLEKERDEMIRKEQMALMFIKQENATFWNTPGDKLIASSDKFFVDPAVLQVISDLDNQLVGLKPVKEKMRR
jgi:hypothetical protein